MTDEEKLGPIEESLRRSFAPPDLSALEAKIDAAARAPAPVVNTLAARRRVFLLAAAVAVAAAALAIFIWSGDRESPQEGEVAASARRDFGANLALFVSDRQLPPPGDIGCETVRHPPNTCLGEEVKPWLPANAPVDVLGECGASVGPSCKRSGLVAGTGLQLRTSSSEPQFFVCMDLLAEDPRPLLPKGSGLRLFRRELGDYVIYEVTPLSEPQALDLFRL